MGTRGVVPPSGLVVTVTGLSVTGMVSLAPTSRCVVNRKIHVREKCHLINIFNKTLHLKCCNFVVRDKESDKRGISEVFAI